jgi:hypothetical protein
VWHMDGVTRRKLTGVVHNEPFASLSMPSGLRGPYSRHSSAKGCLLITVDQNGPCSRSNGRCETALVSSGMRHERQ